MEPTKRICAKVLMIDPDDRILLFRGIDRTVPYDPPVWFLVGGAIHEGETLEAAAIRETFEETGGRIRHLGPLLFTRRFQWVFEGETYDQEETIFLVRISKAVVVSGEAWTDTERATVTGHRWWTVDELRRTNALVYPEDLADVLDRFRR
ncbi:MAG: NUDIX domain-containing protein [Egibacteraceae bacterium]